MTLTHWIAAGIIFAIVLAIALARHEPPRQRRKPQDWRNAIYNPREHRKPR